MIALYVGRRGTGKTLTMVKDMFLYHKRGWKVYTNLESCSFPDRILTNEEILAMVMDYNVRKCVIAIDEIQTLIDSRRSMNEGNVHMNYFIQQIRKRKIILLATTQFIGRVDKGFREHVDILVRPKCLYLEFGYKDVDELHLVKTTYMDLTTEEDLGYIKSSIVYYDPRPVFELYDTEEYIESVNLHKSDNKEKEEDVVI